MPKATVRIAVDWPPEFVERIEAARGTVPRGRWLARATERYLAEQSKPKPEPEPDWSPGPDFSSPPPLEPKHERKPDPRPLHHPDRLKDAKARRDEFLGR
jgi:hypothetical protein